MPSDRSATAGSADPRRISTASAQNAAANRTTPLEGRDRVQLTVLAYESGLVVPGSR